MQNKNKILSILMYVVSAILFICYVLIFAKSFDLSNTSDEYRMFYKENTLAYYLPDDGLKMNYSSGTEAIYVRSGNFRNLGGGWGPIGSEGTWTVGNNSVFYFYIDDASKNQVITISCAQDLGYNNELYVNGNLVGKISFVDGVSVLVINNNDLTDGINEFLIHTDDTVVPLSELRPETEDQNIFNTLIFSIKLEVQN